MSPFSRLLSTALVGAACGCGNSVNACQNVAAGTGTPNSPNILDLGLLSSADTGDPREFIFTLDFQDADGDLALGQYEVFASGGKDAQRNDLIDVFRQSALSFDARHGQLIIPLTFSSIANGARVGVAMALIDHARNRSSCYGIELAFKY